MFLNNFVTLLIVVTVTAACNPSEQVIRIESEVKIQIPEARSGYSMVYDEARDRVVLFGGQNTSDVKLNDTWEWHDGQWYKINTTEAVPSARINAAITYDKHHNRILLFGGLDDNNHLNDTWAYDGEGWELLNISDAPSVRQLATAAYDPINRNTILFGGKAENGDRLGDTWILGDNTWTQAEVEGPTARSSHSMIYDDNEKAVLVYGGNDGTMAQDVWHWRGESWQQLDLINVGLPRLHAAIVYDAEREGTLLIGGFGTNGRNNETWLLKNSEWEQLDFGTKIPKNRAEHEAAYIPGKGTLIFGGVVGADPRQRLRANDTWLLKTNGWVPLVN